MASPPANDDWNFHCTTNRLRQLNVVAPLCAVTVNSVHEYFTGTLIAEAFCKVIGSAGECECAGVRKHRKLACFVLPDVY